MTAKRVYYLMWALLGVSILMVFASAYLGNAIMHRQSDKLLAAKLESRVLDEQQSNLADANKSIAKYSELNEIAKAIVPQDKDQAKSVREIVKLAAESGIKLSSIGFPASTLAPGSNSETQVKKVDGIKGVYQMEITISQDAGQPTTFNNLIDFLSRLENNRRTAQVTNITVQPNAKDRNRLTFSLILNAYLKP